MSGATSNAAPSTPVTSKTGALKVEPRFSGPLQPHVGKEHGFSTGNEIGPGECKYNACL